MPSGSYHAHPGDRYHGIFLHCISYVGYIPGIDHGRTNGHRVIWPWYPDRRIDDRFKTVVGHFRGIEYADADRDADRLSPCCTAVIYPENFHAFADNLRRNGGEASTPRRTARSQFRYDIPQTWSDPGHLVDYRYDDILVHGPVRQEKGVCIALLIFLYAKWRSLFADYKKTRDRAQKILDRYGGAW